MTRGDVIFLVLMAIFLSLFIFSQVGSLLGIIYYNASLLNISKSEACTLDFEMIDGHYSDNLELEFGHEFRYIDEGFAVNVTIRDSEGKTVYTNYVSWESPSLHVETHHETASLSLDKGAYTITLEPYGSKSTDFEAKLTQLVIPELAHTPIIGMVCLGVGLIGGFWFFIIYGAYKLSKYGQKK